ncbi:TolC family protein (plasmid) [Enterobacter bugandensis]|uniref:TolC family protein n=1 Tax=Enterobacter bugandensis TaxID=881260 RepID=UPI00283AB21F|nr:TolC family protein [Enterobacter bugandensis]WMU75480.1 TolC family protein [Enterobacter bugandensis]
MTRRLLGLFLLFLHFSCSSSGPSPQFLQQFSPDENAEKTTRAAQAVVITLDEAVALGLRNNLSIRSAYLNRVAERFDLRVAEDQFAPQLTISGSWQATRDSNGANSQQSYLAPSATLLTSLGTQLSLGWDRDQYNDNQGGRYRNDGVTLSLIQPLLRGAGREVATAPLQQARLTEEVNRINLKTNVSQTIMQIVFTWRALLQSQEQLNIARDAQNRSRQQVLMNEQLIKAGRMAELDRYQAEADEAAQTLTVEDALNQVDNNRLALLRVLNLNLETPLRATRIADIPLIQVSPEKAYQVALEHAPGYLKQVIAGQSAALNLIVARNNQLWDVSIKAGAEQLNSRPGDNHWQGYGGISVSIPVGSLSQQQSLVQAQVSVRQQALSLTDTREELRRSVINGVSSLNSSWNRYQQAKKLRDLSLKKVGAERLSFRAGRSSNFQLLSYEADLRNAEITQLAALIDYLNIQTQLWNTLGLTLESWNIEVKDDVPFP